MTQTTPKIVRKWAQLGIGAWIPVQVEYGYAWWRADDGNMGGIYSEEEVRTNSATLLDGVLKTAPTWEDPEWAAAQRKPGVPSVSTPATPSTRCKYASPVVLTAIESETVELWRYEAPEEVQLATARERVLKRAKRMVRDIPLCPGREMPVSLVTVEKHGDCPISQRPIATVSAAFHCTYCAGGES